MLRNSLLDRNSERLANLKKWLVSLATLAALWLPFTMWRANANEKNQPHDHWGWYMTSAGIGWFEIGLMGMVGLLYVAYNRTAQFQIYARVDIILGCILKPINVRTNWTGVMEDVSTEDVFEFSKERLAKVGFTLGRALLNFRTSVAAFRALPERDPVARLNESEHIVAWFEILVFSTIFPAILGECYRYWRFARRQARVKNIEEAKKSENLVMALGDGNCRAQHQAEFDKRDFRALDRITNSSLGNTAGNIGRIMRFFANFSAMKCVYVFSISSLSDTFTQTQKFTEVYVESEILGTIAGAGFVLGKMGIGVFGALAFVVKINTVSFITTTIYYEWTIPQCVTFAALLSNIAGLVSQDDIATDQVLACASFNSTDPVDATARTSALRDQLGVAVIEKYGRFRGGVRYALLRSVWGPAEWQKLIFQKSD